MILGIPMKDLTLSKEKTYFKIVLVFAILFWLVIAITIVGIFYGLILGLFMWLMNGLFVARLRSECVLVNEQQLPKLYGTFKQVCSQLEVTKIPELYILESAGMLNAFAIRHAGRDFVVILSDILESHGEESDEIRFILGHELGHIKSRHMFKQILLGPALWLPLVGTAYSRAREASCDRYGAYVTQNIDGAIRAMMILSGGKEAGKTMSGEFFSQQHRQHRGFFVSWYELISGYPTASQRVANLISMRADEYPPKYSRHWLAYVFAFFSFGGGSGGGGNMLVTIVIIGILASIALPNLLRAKLAASDKIAQNTLSRMTKAAQAFAQDHGGTYPTSANDLAFGPKKYINVNYCGNTLKGFSYSCTFSPVSFQFTATPIKIGTTGSEVFIVSEQDLVEDTTYEDARGQVDKDFKKLQQLVEQYRKETGEWPSDAEGSLSRPWMFANPKIPEPKDPYDRQPYGYRKYADHYELLSCGPDRESSTKDDIIYKSESVKTGQ